MKVSKGGSENGATAPKIDIKLKDTIPMTSSTGGKIFQEGVILRKLSKFATGSDVDSIIPISVFYDVVSGEIVKELLPKELHAEFGFLEDSQEDQKV